MAAPKVFVSSTCFDLGEVREQLRRFIQSFGFEAVLSENGDVFYHPDLHTHESCIHEVSNCQLFILIIGGRFGGEYVTDKSKSITNAEYMAARESQIPIFTYIRRSVLSNHHIFQQNKKKDFASEIEYPAIEKQEHALNIFSFIDDVRKAPTNNAFEGFDGFPEIENHLRKQWAGMFFDLLKSREVKSQIDATNHLIEGLSSSGRKLESLIKSLYLSSSEDDARREIDSIDVFSDVLSFFERAIRPHWTIKEPYPLDTTKINAEPMSRIPIEGHSWHSYLVSLGLFEYEIFDFPGEDEPEEVLSFCAGTHSHRVFQLSTENKELESLFESGIKRSTQAQRLKALLEIDKKYGEILF
ncbi:DUF4062 domain-containing protein [Aeromonas veronii]